MKKLLLGCFLISGFAVANSKVAETRLCAPEDQVYVSFTTTCGVPAVASGCTTPEIVSDVLQWEEFHCGPLGPL